jgi:tRNA(fMet)-specific endonuclease VapC
MVCVDTDFIIDLGRGSQKAFDKLQELEGRGESIFTTAITVAELYNGAYRAKDRSRALADAKKDLSGFSILNLDYESARAWGDLAERTRSNSIGELDLFIASIAITNKQTLLTRNVKHFVRVPDLTVESW